MDRIAILTGDLIASTAIPGGDVEEAFATLGAAAEEIGRWQDAPAAFARSRGDGWQLALATPRLALRAGLLMRAALRAGEGLPETRIAIAEGPGRAADLPADINAATGPVFTASGRALDALGGGKATMVHAEGGALGATVRLADALSRGWTRAQARAVAPMLAPDAPTRAEAGRALGISRQAVDQALAAAGFPALEDALLLIENSGSTAG